MLRFSVSSWVNPGKLCVQEFIHFFKVFQFASIQQVYRIIYNVSSFISSFFPLVWLANSLFCFIFLFKRHIFSYILIISFISVLILIISCLNFGFCLCFLLLLGCLESLHVFKISTYCYKLHSSVLRNFYFPFDFFCDPSSIQEHVVQFPCICKFSAVALCCGLRRYMAWFFQIRWGPMRSTGRPNLETVLCTGEKNVHPAGTDQTFC